MTSLRLKLVAAAALVAVSGAASAAPPTCDVTSALGAAVDLFGNPSNVGFTGVLGASKNINTCFTFSSASDFQIKGYFYDDFSTLAISSPVLFANTGSGLVAQTLTAPGGYAVFDHFYDGHENTGNFSQVVAAGDYTLFVNAYGKKAGSYFGNVTVSAVPEPETYAMMLAGLGAIGFMARRRKS